MRHRVAAVEAGEADPEDHDAHTDPHDDRPADRPTDPVHAGLHRPGTRLARLLHLRRDADPGAAPVRGGTARWRRPRGRDRLRDLQHQRRPRATRSGALRRSPRPTSTHARGCGCGRRLGPGLRAGPDAGRARRDPTRQRGRRGDVLRRDGHGVHRPRPRRTPRRGDEPRVPRPVPRDRHRPGGGRGDDRAVRPDHGVARRRRDRSTRGRPRRTRPRDPTRRRHVAGSGGRDGPSTRAPRGSAARDRAAGQHRRDGRVRRLRAPARAGHRHGGIRRRAGGLRRHRRPRPQRRCPPPRRARPGTCHPGCAHPVGRRAHGRRYLAQPGGPRPRRGRAGGRHRSADPVGLRARRRRRPRHRAWAGDGDHLGLHRRGVRGGPDLHGPGRRLLRPAGGLPRWRGRRWGGPGPGRRDAARSGSLSPGRARRGGRP
jgi:hypothetical protein